MYYFRVNNEQEEALKQTRIEKLSQMIECIMAGKQKKLLAKGLHGKFVTSQKHLIGPCELK